mgnify:CR=1 FL=1
MTAKSLVYARPIDANNLNSSYYGSTPSLTLGFFSASSGGTQYNLVSGDYTGAIVYSGAPTATSIPGSYSISYSSGVSISNASYYLAGTGASLTWTVNAKPLTITGVTAQNKTFDGNSTARLAGTPQAAWLTGDVVSLDASAVVAQFGSTAVGTAIPVTVTGYALIGASAGNYSLIQPTGLTADILAAASTNVPPVVPPIILPPAPVTPPSVPPGTSPISKEVLPTPPVAELIDLGCTDVGENRDQEASAKFDQTNLLRPSNNLNWHFIGQLQTNKVKSVLRYAKAIHSIDRPSLVQELAKQLEKQLNRRLKQLVPLGRL